jgi:cob(I)alamin adenosyltransferase
MPIYTKTGDTGDTSLWGGQREGKDTLRMEVIGTVDETQAAIGVARSFCPDVSVEQYLEQVQDQLYRLMAELAKAQPTTYSPLTEQDVTMLEIEIDRLQSQLDGTEIPLTAFLRPGGEPIVTTLHLARTISRRLERLMITLHRSEELAATHMQYINRLSDYLFQIARYFSASGTTSSSS